MWEAYQRSKFDRPFLTQPELQPYHKGQFDSAVEKNAKIWNLQHGLQSLTDKLEATIIQLPNAQIELDTSVVKIERNNLGEFQVTNARGHSSTFDQIFSTIAPDVLGSILDPNSFPDDLISSLSQFRFSTVHVYLVELKDMILPKDIGFGFLVPTCEDESILGVIYDSCSFPEHDAVGSRFTIMTTKALNPADVLKYCINIETCDWQHELVASIPLMDAYHLNNAQPVKEEAKKLGLNLIGNYFNGVSVNDCLYNAAVEMQNYCDSQRYLNVQSNTPFH